MADTKISALTASTTPLAGTEVLPIVQSGTTKQVSVANLTAGRSVAMLSANVTNSALTFHNSFFTNTGALAVGRSSSVWLGNGTTVFGASDRQWGLSSTVDSAGTNTNLEINYYNGSTYSTSAVFLPTGDLRVNTGNLVIATPGKGIDFSATPGTGTSELLADYEEGTWTPSLGGNTTYTAQTGTYTKVGRMVTVNFIVIVNVLGTGSASSVSGLPFSNSGANRGGGGVTYVDTPASAFASINPYVQPSTSAVKFSTSSVLGAWTDNNSVYADGTGIGGTVTYFV
jgi:hypothetical protein